jgi:hypothetical protein
VGQFNNNRRHFGEGEAPAEPLEAETALRVSHRRSR